MAEANGPPTRKADAMALVEEAEAEAVAAEALATAARARARAARLRREALTLADGEAPDTVTEPRGRPSIAKAAALVLILCLAGASGYMVWRHREATRQQQRVAAFVAGRQTRGHQPDFAGLQQG